MRCFSLFSLRSSALACSSIFSRLCQSCQLFRFISSERAAVLGVSRSRSDKEDREQVAARNGLSLFNFFFMVVSGSPVRGLGVSKMKFHVVHRRPFRFVLGERFVVAGIVKRHTFASCHPIPTLLPAVSARILVGVGVFLPSHVERVSGMTAAYTRKPCRTRILFPSQCLFHICLEFWGYSVSLTNRRIQRRPDLYFSRRPFRRG